MDDVTAVLGITITLFSIQYVGMAGIWREIGRIRERLTRMETLCFPQKEVLE